MLLKTDSPPVLLNGARAVVTDVELPLESAAKGLCAKRLFDLALGIPIALMVLPAIAVLAIGVTFSLRCWPFFTQRRTGQGGKEFRVLKLRTLPKSFPAYASKFEWSEDSLPRFVRFLRRRHLDEVPQLLLVPVGKMSLVGPRPKMPDDAEPIDYFHGRLRLLVPQGCTGLWQVGEHAHLRVCDAAQYDFAYLRFGGIALDLWILWRTALTVLGLGRAVSVEGDTTIPRWARGRGFLSEA
jgi:lipopolysaccharide/colanic/teichoic acid biosynthesis glycosyltransferase